MAEGFIGGYMEGMAWKQDRAMNDLNMQKLGQEVEASKTKIDAHRKMLELAQSKHDQMVTQKGGVEPSTLETMQILADSEAAVGNSVEAAAIMKDVTGMQVDEAQLQIAHYNLGIKAFEDMQYGLSKVHDEESKNFYWKSYFADHPAISQQPELYQRMQGISREPYNAQRYDNMAHEGLSQKDMLQQELVKAQTSHQQALTSEAEYRRTRVLPQQVKASEELTAARVKHLGEGGAGKKTTDGDRAVAASFIADKYEMTGSEDQKKVLAAVVADRAKEIIEERPLAMKPLTKAQATKMAFDELDKQNTFAGLPKAEKELGTRSNPAPLPATPGELVDNSIYPGAGKYKGQLMVYKEGVGFLPLSGIPDISYSEDIESPPEDMSEPGEK